MIQNLLWFIFLWCGKRLFIYIDIYAPNQEEVVGITFSTKSSYLELIKEIEE